VAGKYTRPNAHWLIPVRPKLPADQGNYSKTDCIGPRFQVIKILGDTLSG